MADRKTEDVASGGKPSLSDSVYRWEGLAFNAVCVLYFVLLAPGVAEVAGAAVKDPVAEPVWLGVVLIAISLLEIYAYPVKMRIVRRAIRHHGDDAGNSAVYLWMFHAVLSIIIVFTAASAFGVKIGGEGESQEMPWWLSLIIVVTVLKELAFLMFTLGSGDDLPEGIYDRPKAKERIVDIILVVYACLGYTAIWGAITKDLEMQRHNLPMYMINLVLACLMFLIFYLPLRIPYVVEERAQIKNSTDELKFWGSVLLVMIPTVWALR